MAIRPVKALAPPTSSGSTPAQNSPLTNQSVTATAIHNSPCSSARPDTPSSDRDSWRACCASSCVSSRGVSGAGGMRKVLWLRDQDVQADQGGHRPQGGQQHLPAEQRRQGAQQAGDVRLVG